MASKSSFQVLETTLATPRRGLDLTPHQVPAVITLGHLVRRAIALGTLVEQQRIQDTVGVMEVHPRGTAWVTLDSLGYQVLLEQDKVV